MARNGKTLMVASGSRRRNISRAENAARRSRKRADRRAAFRHEQKGGDN